MFEAGLMHMSFIW